MSFREIRVECQATLLEEITWTWGEDVHSMCGDQVTWALYIFGNSRYILGMLPASAGRSGLSLMVQLDGFPSKLASTDMQIDIRVATIHSWKSYRRAFVCEDTILIIAQSFGYPRSLIIDSSLQEVTLVSYLQTCSPTRQLRFNVYQRRPTMSLSRTYVHQQRLTNSLARRWSPGPDNRTWARQIQTIWLTGGNLRSRTVPHMTPDVGNRWNTLVSPSCPSLIFVTCVRSCPQTHG